MVGMRDRGDSVFTFLFLLGISILILLINLSPFSSVNHFFLSPSYTFLSNFPFLGQDSQNQKLKEETLLLSKKNIDEGKLIAENKALHDQFSTFLPKNFDLLPANVISAPRFIPGVTSPYSYLINVGSEDGVRAGNAVILKDNLVGKIVKVENSLSEVDLVVNPDFILAGRTNAGVLGVIKGQGNQDILFDNVLLSDSLLKGDFVLTIGDMKLDSSGLPGGIIVGKITSMEKNPSEIFQKGKIESLLDFPSLQTVFVIRGYK